MLERAVTSPAFSDQQLLDATPEVVFLQDLLKATPRYENGERVLYIEASNEKLDQQGEVVVMQALKESADYFLKFGNLDLDHYTIIGARLGIPDYLSYEIGRPVDCRFERGRTFVKGRIFQGDGPMAKRANDFWSSLVDLNPPQRWYPSVGGKCGPREIEVGKDGTRRSIVRSVRWYNIGFSKTPVNANVPEVSTVPMDVFVKSWGARGWDHTLAKTLTAGYGTDSVGLSGGSALRVQSLDRKLHSYFDLRDSVAGDMRAGRVKNDARLPDFIDFVSRTYGLDEDAASEFVERFARDIRDGIKKPVSH